MGEIRTYFTLSKARTAYAPLLLLIYIITAYALSPEFLSLVNIKGLVFSACLLLPATLGMQVLMIAGKFDLSIGSVAAMAGITAALMPSTAPTILVFSAAAAVGIFAGFVSGLFVALIQFDTLIATVAMMGIVRSFALAVPDGHSISVQNERFRIVAGGTFAGVEKIILYGVVITLVLDLLLRFHVASRRLYAVGSNPVAASASGLNIETLRLFAFVIAGAGASITGMLQASRAMAASPLVFQDLPLDSIAACVIGGASLRGGRGTILGASFGLLVVVATRNLVTMLDVSVYWRYAFIGGLLLLAASADVLKVNRRKTEQ
jgi:ribose transport system permease protein